MIHVIDGGRDGLVVVVSATGGRISAITGPSGREWLVPGTHPEPDPSAPVDFTAGTRGGWDECLPSIDPEIDPNRGHPSQIADHGDLWYRPWRVTPISEREVVADSKPIEHPLQLCKTMRVAPGKPWLEVDHLITNRTLADYRFVYSAHPLWSMPAGARLEIPGAGRVLPAFGFDAEAGAWPNLGDTDVSIVPATPRPVCSKFFVEWAGELRLTLTGGASMRLRQSTLVTPWLGVCVNRGVWPPGDPGPDWIALEPTTSPTDSLAAAIARGTAAQLAPGSSTRWTTRIDFSE